MEVAVVGTFHLRAVATLTLSLRHHALLNLKRGVTMAHNNSYHVSGSLLVVAVGTGLQAPGYVLTDLAVRCEDVFLVLGGPVLVL